VSEFCIDVRSQGRARVGISVGAAVYGKDGQTLDQLLVAADQAMYRAKSAHKTGASAGKPHARGPRNGSKAPANDLIVTTTIN